MDIQAALARLDLPDDSYMVVGSGILSALGLRESHDVDLLVSADVYARLQANGWQAGHRIDRPVIFTEGFDAGMYWEDQRLDDWLPRAVRIDGIPFLSLEDVLRWKQRHARPKDAADIDLIKAYLLAQT